MGVSTLPTAVKTRLQASAKYSSPVDCFRQTWHGEGARAFYQGLAARVVGHAPLSSLTWTTFFAVSRALDQHFPADPMQRGPAFGNLFVAGCAAGVLAVTIASPIELAKCRLQIQTRQQAQVPGQAGGSALPHYSGPIDCLKQVWHKQGLAGLYRGYSALLARDIPAFGVYWSCYEWFKWKLTDGRADRLGPLSMMAAGAGAGMVSWAVTYPLDPIKSVIQTSPDSVPKEDLRMARLIKHYYQQHGVRWFFRGFGITMIRAIPTNGTSFAVFELVYAMLGGKRHVVPEQIGGMLAES